MGNILENTCLQLQPLEIDNSSYICLRESIQIKKPFCKDDRPDIEKEPIIDYEGLNSPEDC